MRHHPLFNVAGLLMLAAGCGDDDATSPPRFDLVCSATTQGTIGPLAWCWQTQFPNAHVATGQGACSWVRPSNSAVLEGSASAESACPSGGSRCEFSETSVPVIYVFGDTTCLDVR